ncbi:hypothetical protein C491_14927 [Natronococcus amylolyticus DSM 10524]|uniref:Halobacterial output domain-containing protein n=1 Tax=Natronococcus amylolyticus DSM 10524 TaxID=1227497 RepID=L9X457_9EURY|nr:HalOD1 output domain-containing protein [Natronococcus amylolyticus]ELY56251.1 hypothetical protein C491_14927 [Natronococcus amylolyticus DSM 10524]
MDPKFPIRRTEKDKSATVEVVKAVATIRDIPLEELPPLYYTIDTDALDTLVETKDNIIVRFEYQGFEVRVKPDEICLKEQ